MGDSVHRLRQAKVDFNEHIKIFVKVGQVFYSRVFVYRVNPTLSKKICLCFG